MVIVYTLLATIVYIIFIFSLIVIFEHAGDFIYKDINSDDLKKFSIWAITTVYLLSLIIIWIYYCM